MIQIKIEIEENGVNITITTPLGKKLQFRSTAENDKIKKESTSVHITDDQVEEKVDIIKKRKVPVFKIKRICKNCQLEFLPTSARQEFCTTHCKEMYKLEKNSTEKGIKKTDKLADELEQETKKSGVEKEVKKIATDHPDLTKRLCKTCGSPFKPEGNEKICKHCIQNR